MLKLKTILFEEVIALKPIPPAESNFGPSYNSPYVKGDVEFAKILVPVNNEAGEVEYGMTGPDSAEIISIYFEKGHRGKGYGSQTINMLVKTLKLKELIALASPSSKPFWRRLGFQPMEGNPKYFVKRF